MTIMMTTTETIAKTPTANRVTSDIMKKVAAGKLSPGQRLLDERALAKDYKVSRYAIRQALEHLCEKKVIERIQGSGTYIKKPQAARNKIAVMCYSTHAQGDEYTFYSLSYLTRYGSSRGNEIAFHAFENKEKLQAGLEAINHRADLVGGIVLSPNTPQDIKFINRHCRIPLVVLGDMATRDRVRPIIDQVTGSSYQIGYQGTQELLKKGCQSLAAIVVDRNFIWNIEAIEGFCDATGNAPASSEAIHVFHETNRAALESPDVYEIIHWSEKMVSQWLTNKNLPDGVFVSDLWLMQGLVSAFEKLGVPLAKMPVFCLWMNEESLPHKIERNIRVVMIRSSMEKICEQAFKRLEEKNAGDTVKKLEIVEDVIISCSRC